MKQVIAIMPLPEWEIDGVKYKANERVFMTSPPELEQHISVTVGTWIELPSGDAGISVAARMKNQNGKQLESKAGELARFEGGTHPTLQRFAFEVREVAEAGDNLDELFADTPIRKLDGTASENPWKAARAEVAKLAAENEKLKAEVATLTATIADAAKAAKGARGPK